MPETSDMQRLHQIRSILSGAARMLVVCVLLPAPPQLHAQMMGRQRGSILPATAPTPPPPAPDPAPQQVTEPPPTPAATPASRASVTYADGLLSISATNSSLNQILREISRETGMKITGGVTDERVFGTYGPGSPAKILATLLDGTGSNMILVQGTRSQQGSTVSSNAAPLELVLTPRHGGPTPPNPIAPCFNDGADPDNLRPPQTITNRPLPPSIPVADPNGAANSPIAPAATSVPPPLTTPTDPTAPTTQDQSPNGVKTPQQIYDQLLKLRQQQQTPPSH